VGEAGHGWIEEHIPHDATRWGKADVVGRRYVTDLVNAAVDDGMNVGG
jgi:hypothetical protein